MKFFLKQNCSKKFRSQNFDSKTREAVETAVYHSVSCCIILLVLQECQLSHRFHAATGLATLHILHQGTSEPGHVSSYQPFLQCLSPQLTPTFQLLHISFFHSHPHFFETAGSSPQLATAPSDLSQPRGFLNTALLVPSQTAFLPKVNQLFFNINILQNYQVMFSKVKIKHHHHTTHSFLSLLLTSPILKKTIYVA